MSKIQGADDVPATRRGPASQRRYRLTQVANVVAGLACGLITYAVNADLQLSLALGVIVTMGLLIVEYTAVTNSLMRVVHATNDRLICLGADLSKQDGLAAALAHLRGSAREGGNLAHTINRVHEAVPNIPVPLFGVVDDLLGQAARALETGHIVLGGSSSSLGSHLVRTFERDVFCTSFHPLDFWLTPYGRNYQAEIRDRLRELAKTGEVTFRRVFIVRGEVAEELRRQPYRGVIEEQLSAGIDVRITYEEDLPADLCVDFGIWDGELEVELECDEQRRIIARHYRYSHEHLAAAQRRAERLWDRSIAYADFLTRLPGCSQLPYRVHHLVPVAAAEHRGVDQQQMQLVQRNPVSPAFGQRPHLVVRRHDPVQVRRPAPQVQQCDVGLAVAAVGGGVDEPGPVTSPVDVAGPQVAVQSRHRFRRWRQLFDAGDDGLDGGDVGGRQGAVVA
ncbi:hypothetical protein Snas_6075 [Stackebrandtia nassauensis DSM 44728]|uniref:DUF6879 domain-containing protein n=1 Tax=Stackebrandtia nassauensis (strain DSM 44728 / CIP 108903 / NRRL B-16338 / NBRC 102104 / LLR-40K-21) TaxID=446470 RepID=D3Q1B9_STANL|nr:hypothetical protein Snas_6075 [Stackebrandtia nassauensis DSM 44728]